MEMTQMMMDQMLQQRELMLEERNNGNRYFVDAGTGE